MSSSDRLSHFSLKQEAVTFEPSRHAGLQRLGQFKPRAGAHYANQRNFDLGSDNRSTVSGLSPWIKHRLVDEKEVLAEVFSVHDLSASMKFVQEVFWRGYFKGWMQQRPSVWHYYKSNLKLAFEGLERDLSRKADYVEATKGRTGISCFDHWCSELKSTGYLHNHARMWFASIWIFTLRLPWELGADFFLNHLIDGDPAANTLSWRWVGGLHTKGKTYLACPSNIAKFTEGRFEPIGQLSTTAEPLTEEVDHSLVPLMPVQPMPEGDFLLLITPEDCQPNTFIEAQPAGVLGLLPASNSHQSEKVQAFAQGAVADALSRFEHLTSPATATNNWVEHLVEATRLAGTTQIVTSLATLGPVASHLDAAKARLAEHGISLHQHQRTYDGLVWPHATKGFFNLKKKIPTVLTDLGFVMQ